VYPVHALLKIVRQGDWEISDVKDRWLDHSCGFRAAEKSRGLGFCFSYILRSGCSYISFMVSQDSLFYSG
jgi:hypothetical protein